MNLLHLKYAVEVEKTGSITQAAENLFMGQPNLSKAIKELEATVGMLIFKRTSKGVVATPKGAEFLERARAILSQMEALEQEYRPHQEDRVSLSVCIPRASYIAYAFANFVKGLDLGKELDVNFRETSSVETIGCVARGEFDVGIIRYNRQYEKYFMNQMVEKGLQYEPVCSFDKVILLNHNHPLAGQETVSEADLAPYIEIAHGDHAVPYLSFAEMKEEEPSLGARRIHIYERGSQFCLLKRVPGCFMWVSPVPDEVLDRHNLVQRRCPTAKQAHRDLLVYHKDRKLNVYEKAFLNEVFAVRDGLGMHA